MAAAYPLSSSTSAYPYGYEYGPNSIPQSSKSNSNWDDEIVPALRRKLESQSQTLNKRLSRIQNSAQGNQASNPNGTSHNSSDLNSNGNSIDDDDRFQSSLEGKRKREGKQRERESQRERDGEGSRNGASSNTATTSNTPNKSFGNSSEDDQYLHNKGRNKGRKSEPTSNAQTQQAGLGFGQPSKAKAKPSTNQELQEVGNQTFPTLDSGGFCYDPEEEPAGADARREYRIRAQSQRLASRNNSTAIKVAEMRAQKLKEQSGLENGDGSRNQYPPSSRRDIGRDEERNGVRKVPSLGDTNRSYRDGSNNGIPPYSKIPRPIRRDSHTSVRSERSERSLRGTYLNANSLEKKSSNNAINGNDRRRDSASEGGMLNTNISPGPSPNSPTFQAQQQEPSTPQPRNGMTRSDSRKAAKTPTKQQLEEFGPLGGGSNSNGDHRGTEKSRKFGTAPSGLALMSDDSGPSKINGNTRIGKSSNQSTSSSNRLNPQAAIASSLSTSSSASELRSLDDVRSAFYTTHQATKWDDQYLPTVAKRLQVEAMREARFSQIDGGLLVDTWDVNGLPLTYKDLNSNEKPKTFEDIKAKEQELKAKRDEELNKLNQDGQKKLENLRDEDGRRRVSTSNRREKDRNNEIEMQRIQYHDEEIHARRSSEHAKRLVHDSNQLKHKAEASAEAKKKKKEENEAGCCKCMIM